MQPLKGRRVLVTGGTGSLGQRLVLQILGGKLGRPESVVVLSRDEAKQHDMRLSYLHQDYATDEVIYKNFKDLLSFRIGDVRDYSAILQAVNDADVVFHAAALKQVPTCEYFPGEAVQTNIGGAINLVRAIRENKTPVKAVLGISTDKACKPINVMGMTKSLMERVFVEANLRGSGARFCCVRYGNVIASRGSVLPLFLSQIKKGGPVTITTKEMTRFLLTLDQAVDTVFAALKSAQPGEIFVPKAPSAKIVDLARALMVGREVPIVYTGIRPGEKIHEIMISEEEVYRTTERDGYYAVTPMLTELEPAIQKTPLFEGEYSSSNVTLDQDGLGKLLAPYLRGELSAEMLT